MVPPRSLKKKVVDGFMRGGREKKRTDATEIISQSKKGPTSQKGCPQKKSGIYWVPPRKGEVSKRDHSKREKRGRSHQSKGKKKKGKKKGSRQA